MKKEREYRICKRCVMDTSDRAIAFTSDGGCNHCSRQERRLREQRPLEERKSALGQIVERIKQSGKGRKYDCLVGVSGGVDSTYVAYLCAQMGLRPLAVHLDNGWNSELAVSNIQKTLEKCGIDLHTHVIDWNEFKDLQLSFLKASIPGMEIPTDHAIHALLYSMSRRFGIRYVMSGSNLNTEGIMAQSWSEIEGQRDWLLIKNIHRQFGEIRLKTYPHFSLIQRFYYKLMLRNVNVNLLNYFDYDKEKVMEEISKKLGWVYYGGKHYESIYTRFTQGYIQPKKFGFDKRRAHLSSLIVSGQIARDEALEILGQPPYPDPDLENSDLELFKKKLDLSDEEFDDLMGSPVKAYTDYRGYSTVKTYDYINSSALKAHELLKQFGFYGVKH